LIDDLVSVRIPCVNVLAVPISSERVRRSMLWVPRGAWPLVLTKSSSPLASRPGVISTRRGGWAPVVRLAEEHDRLHRLPRVGHTLCFGETRKVNWQSLISGGSAQYSVPHQLIDRPAWGRADGEQLIVVHVDGPRGPREGARRRLTTPGRPAICDEHYPPRPAGALERVPRARDADERTFLQIGPGAERWLIRAAAAGAQRVRRKMCGAVDLSKLHGTVEGGPGARGVRRSRAVR
jgi:hypothetical protein